MDTQMSKRFDAQSPIIGKRELLTDRTMEFLIIPDRDQCEALANMLNVSFVRKLRFEGTMSPYQTHDWLLEAKLHATIIQPCSVTTKPVTTRIESPYEVKLIKHLPKSDDQDVEAPDDETAEPLGNEVNLLHIMESALSLEIPDFPRSESAETVDIVVGPAGRGDDDTNTRKPFAGLAELKNKLASE